MKKISSFIALTLFAITIAFTSCKKDYTCECTTTVGSSSTTQTTTITDIRSDAKAECNDKDQSTTVGGITTTVDCDIK